MADTLRVAMSGCCHSLLHVPLQNPVQRLGFVAHATAPTSVLFAVVRFVHFPASDEMMAFYGNRPQIFLIVAGKVGVECQ